MDLMTVLNIALLAVHILSFAVLFGALLHVRFFVTPALASDAEGPQKLLAMSANGAMWIHGALALSLVTGLAQYGLRAKLINHPVIGTKILIALVGFAFVSMVFRRKGEPRPIATVQKHATIGLLLFSIVIVLASVTQR